LELVALFKILTAFRIIKARDIYTRDVPWVDIFSAQFEAKKKKRKVFRGGTSYVT